MISEEYLDKIIQDRVYVPSMIDMHFDNMWKGKSKNLNIETFLIDKIKENDQDLESEFITKINENYPLIRKHLSEYLDTPRLIKHFVRFLISKIQLIIAGVDIVDSILLCAIAAKNLSLYKYISINMENFVKYEEKHEQEYSKDFLEKLKSDTENYLSKSSKVKNYELSILSFLFESFKNAFINELDVKVKNRKFIYNNDRVQNKSSFILFFYYSNEGTIDELLFNKKNFSKLINTKIKKLEKDIFREPSKVKNLVSKFFSNIYSNKEISEIFYYREKKLGTDSDKRKSYRSEYYLKTEKIVKLKSVFKYLIKLFETNMDLKKSFYIAVGEAVFNKKEGASIFKDLKAGLTNLIVELIEKIYKPERNNASDVKQFLQDILKSNSTHYFLIRAMSICMKPDEFGLPFRFTKKQKEDLKTVFADRCKSIFYEDKKALNLFDVSDYPIVMVGMWQNCLNVNDDSASKYLIDTLNTYDQCLVDFLNYFHTDIGIYNIIDNYFKGRVELFYKLVFPKIEELSKEGHSQATAFIKAYPKS